MAQQWEMQWRKCYAKREMLVHSAPNICFSVYCAMAARKRWNLGRFILGRIPKPELHCSKPPSQAPYRWLLIHWCVETCHFAHCCVTANYSENEMAPAKHQAKCVLGVAKIYGFIFSNMHVMLRYCNCASPEWCFLCLKLGHISLFTTNFPVWLTHIAFFLLLLTAFIVHVTLYHYLDKLMCQSIRI